MYTADLRITAQYEENYNWHNGQGTSEGENKLFPWFDGNNKPYWKKKGGVEFIIKGIEPDPVLYAAPGEAEDAIQTLLDEKSNNHSRYTLISWEFIYSEPIELDADAFLFEMGIGME